MVARKNRFQFIANFSQFISIKHNLPQQKLKFIELIYIFTDLASYHVEVSRNRRTGDWSLCCPIYALRPLLAGSPGTGPDPATS